MRPLLPFAVVLAALAGCSETSAQREERKLAMMEQAGADKDEICAQAQKVAAARLDAGDQRNYELAKVTADVRCSSARIDRLIR